MTTNTRRGSAVPGGFGAGVGGALALLVVMGILRLTTNTISIPELMEESLIRLTGGQIESFFINNLGVGGKALLLVSIVEGTLLLGGVLGLLYTRFWPGRPAPARGRVGSGLLYGLLIGLLLNVVLLPLFGQGLFGADAVPVTAPQDLAQTIYGQPLAPVGVPVWLNMFLLSCVFGLALVTLLPWGRAAVAAAAGAGAAGGRAALSRRDFMKALGGTALALVGGGVLWTAVRAALTPPPAANAQLVDAGAEPTPAAGPRAAGTGTPDAIHHSDPMPTPPMTEMPATPGPTPNPAFAGVKPKLVPEVTPVENFYITTKNFVDPVVDANAWKLNFKGLVSSPFSVTLADLQALPAVDRIETLACISNPLNGALIGNGRWRGVNFADLLARAKPQAGVMDVVVRAADGYSDSFPLDVALHNECVLVYEMNGKPLTTKHGYPVRLLVPNIYGMKNCKWITDVELVNYDYKGYWQNQGWSDPALYQTLTRIDYPDGDSIAAKPIYVGGMAFAGNRGIKRVEVSTDGGKTWNDAQVRQPLGPYTWVLWTYPWIPTPGAYTLQARATDGTGAVQTDQVRDTYPNGATGYASHAVRVG